MNPSIIGITLDKMLFMIFIVLWLHDNYVFKRLRLSVIAVDIVIGSDLPLSYSYPVGEHPRFCSKGLISREGRLSYDQLTLAQEGRYSLLSYRFLVHLLLGGLRGFLGFIVYECINLMIQGGAMLEVAFE